MTAILAPPPEVPESDAAVASMLDQAERDQHVVDATNLAQLTAANQLGPLTEENRARLAIAEGAGETAIHAATEIANGMAPILKISGFNSCPCDSTVVY